MADENEEQLPLDRPDQLPEQQSAVDPQESERRETKKRLAERKRREWLTAQLADPVGREFLWGILAACSTFEEKYGFAGDGSVNKEATWSYIGQKDLGLRFYHQWSLLDRAGVLSLLDEFHPHFRKLK